MAITPTSSCMGQPRITCHWNVQDTDTEWSAVKMCPSAGKVKSSLANIWTLICLRRKWSYLFFSFNQVPVSESNLNYSFKFWKLIHAFICSRHCETLFTTPSRLLPSLDSGWPKDLLAGYRWLFVPKWNMSYTKKCPSSSPWCEHLNTLWRYWQ